MSGQKKGFSQFIRPSANSDVAQPPQPLQPQETLTTSTPSDAAPLNPAVLGSTTSDPAAADRPERIRQVTSTGRVRTHSANRALPGVTLRLTEERWERLKMLSIQQRRPIQDILGEAMEGFMRARGLPW